MGRKSGRNPEPGFGHRIEEHGFHVWLGFYDNAFKMIQESYAEGAWTTGPFRTWTDAFKKHSLVVIQEVIDGERKQWQTGRGNPDAGSRPSRAVRIRGWDVQAALRRASCDTDTRTGEHRSGPQTMATIWRTAFVALLLGLSVAEYFPRLWKTGSDVNWKKRGFAARRVRAAASLGSAGRAELATIVEASSQLLMAWADGAQVSNPDDGRRLRIFFDLSLAVLRGITDDDIIAKGFESIDHSVQGLASPAQRTAGERHRRSSPRSTTAISASPAATGPGPTSPRVWR